MITRYLKRRLRAAWWIVAILMVIAATLCEADTASVVAAVNTFEGTLTSSQLSAVKYDFTLANAEVWSNLPVSLASRNGLAFSTLSSTQLAAALAVAQTALSSEGYTLFANIRAADDVIGQVDSSMWGSGKYYIAILGTPSTTSPWMLQLGGHHIAYNIVYNGSYTSGSPMFDGVEPPTWTASDGTAYAPLEAQRSAMYAILQAISSNSSALLSGTFDDVLFGPNGTSGHDTNYPQSYPTGTSGRGVLVSSLTSAQQTLVKTAIEAWVDKMPSDIANTLLLLYEADSNLSQTYVAYSGASTLASQGSYVRVDGPRVWIEFVVQSGVAYPNGVHYHTIWRDKTSDYGGSFSSSTTSTSTTTTTTTTSSSTSTSSTSTSTSSSTSSTSTSTSASSGSSSGGGGAPSLLWFGAIALLASVRVLRRGERIA